MVIMSKPDLLLYNAFGLISISSQRITANITVVIGEKSFSRSVVRDLDAVPGVADGEQTAVVFGAWIETGKKARIVVNEIGKLESGMQVSDISEVGKVLMEAIDLVRVAADI